MLDRKIHDASFGCTRDLSIRSHPGDNAKHGIREPPPPFDGLSILMSKRLVELEFQGVNRPGQRCAERLWTLLNQEVARVEPLRQRRNRQIDVLAGENLKGPVHPRAPSRVRIKY